MSSKEEDDDDIVCLESPPAPQSHAQLPIVPQNDTNTLYHSILLDDTNATLNYTQECEHNCDDIPTSERQLSPEVVSISDDDDIDYLMRNKDILQQIDAVPLNPNTLHAANDSDNDVLLIEMADKMEREIGESRAALLPIKPCESLTSDSSQHNEDTDTLSRILSAKTYEKGSDFANKKRLRDSVEFERVVSIPQTEISSPKRLKTHSEVSPTGLLAKFTDNKKISPNIQRQTTLSGFFARPPKSPSLTPTSRNKARTPSPKSGPEDEDIPPTPLDMDASQRTVFKSLFGFTNVHELSSPESSSDEGENDKKEANEGEPVPKMPKIETKNMNFIKQKLIERSNFMSKFGRGGVRAAPAPSASSSKYAEYAKKMKNHELAGALLAKSKASEKKAKAAAAVPLQNATTLTQGIRIAKAELNARKMITEARNHCIEKAKASGEPDESDEDDERDRLLARSSKSVAEPPKVAVEPKKVPVGLKKDEFLVHGVKHTKTAGFAKPVKSAPAKKDGGDVAPKKTILIDSNLNERKKKIAREDSNESKKGEKDLVSELINGGCMREPKYNKSVSRENGGATYGAASSSSAEPQCRYIFEDFLFRILKCSFNWLIEQGYFIKYYWKIMEFLLGGFFWGF